MSPLLKIQLHISSEHFLIVLLHSGKNQNWFAKFRSGNIDLINEKLNVTERKVDNDELEVDLESQYCLSSRELSL